MGSRMSLPSTMDSSASYLADIKVALQVDECRSGSVIAARNDASTSIKVVLRGDSGVGKSSILLKFVAEEADPCSTVRVGTAFVSRAITLQDSTALKFDVWDTAGNDKFAFSASLCYAGASSAILVYDITRAKTFEKAQLWVQELHKIGGAHMVMALVGNKADLHASREVDAATAQKYAECNGMLFRETSAKTSDSIKQLFVEIGSRLPQNNSST